MGQSLLRTGANQLLKVAWESGDEVTIGYAQSFTFTVVQGQKMMMTVDSPFPQEIAQGAAPSFVRGTMVLYAPKGTSVVKAGLVPPQTDLGNDLPRLATSRYSHWRIYDRFTHELSYAVNFVKINTWTVSNQAKSLVMITMSFEGMFIENGLS